MSALLMGVATMWGNIVGRQIRRGSRNLLITGLIAVLILAALIFSNDRYLLNFLAGPTPMTPTALLKINDVDSLPRYYVYISKVRVKDTGVQSVEQSVDEGTGKVESQKVDAEYFIAKIGNKWLLVKSPDPTPRSEYTGALVRTPSDVRAQFQPVLDKHNLKWDDVFLPYSLDATGFNTRGFVILAASLLLAFIGIAAIPRGLRRLRDPSVSPVARTLQKYGSRPEVVASQIDNDFAQSRKEWSWPSLMLSKSWLLKPTLYGLAVMNLDDLVWSYEKVVRRRVDFIPIGKNYSAVICDRHGQTIEHAAKRKAVASVLEELAKRAPWAVVGYSKEIEQMFKKNRAGFVAAVEERRNSPGSAQ